VKGLSVVIPCYNEADSLRDVVDTISNGLARMSLSWEIIVVDDASTDGSVEVITTRGGKVRIIRSRSRMGYGASLKRGLGESAYDFIAIIDSDGTYPAGMLPAMVEQVIDQDLDMLVGARTKPGVKIPLIRRPAKWMINRLAEYLAGQKIPDVNSGMRIMRKKTVKRFLNILPDGFSFTTTITLAMLTNDYAVEYVPMTLHEKWEKTDHRYQIIWPIVHDYYRQGRVFYIAPSGIGGYFNLEADDIHFKGVSPLKTWEHPYSKFKYRFPQREKPENSSGHAINMYKLSDIFNKIKPAD